MDGERSRYTDDRLDDRFNDIDRRLKAVDALPALLAGVSAQLAALQVKVTDNHVAQEKRMDTLDGEIGGVSRALWSLLAGLLLVTAAAVVGVVVLL